jgi:RHS repeat-associated protein
MTASKKIKTAAWFSSVVFMATVFTAPQQAFADDPDYTPGVGQAESNPNTGKNGEVYDGRTGSMGFNLDLMKIPGVKGLEMPVGLTFNDGPWTERAGELGFWSLQVPTISSGNFLATACQAGGYQSVAPSNMTFMLYLPGQAPKLFQLKNTYPTGGVNYFTEDNWVATCVNDVNIPPNATQGQIDFIIQPPTGNIRYNFRRLPVVTLQNGFVTWPNQDFGGSLNQSGAYFMISSITDMHGNSITFNYTASETGTCTTAYAGCRAQSMLTSMVRNDGAQIIFNYQPHTFQVFNGSMQTLTYQMLSSFSTNGKTWNFGYKSCVDSGSTGTTNSTMCNTPPLLGTITRPDGQAWNFSYINIPNSKNSSGVDTAGRVNVVPFTPGGSLQISSITAPDGLVSSYSYYSLCGNYLNTTQYGYPTGVTTPNKKMYPGAGESCYDYYGNFMGTINLALATKTYTGPGIPTPISYQYQYYVPVATDVSSATTGSNPVNTYTFELGPSKMKTTTYVSNALNGGAGQRMAKEEDIFPLPPAGTVTAAALLAYDQTMAAQCTAPNFVNCQGEVKTIFYTGGGSTWAWNPLCMIPRDNSVNLIVAGCTLPPGTLGAHRLAQVNIYRSTGVYVTQFSNFDSYMNAQTKTEYSLYYNSVTGALSSNPARYTNTVYYNNTNAIAGDPNGLQANIIGLPQSMTVSDGATVFNSESYTYYGDGQPKSWISNGIEKDYTYDSNGNLYTESEWRSGTSMVISTFTSYVDGIAQIQTKPLGSVLTKVINPDGTVASETDAMGHTTTFQYDANFRVSQINHPLGSPTVFTRPNELTLVETRGNSQKIKVSDAMGHVIRVTEKDLGSGKTIVKSNCYDAYGRIIYQSHPGWSSPSPYGIQTVYDVLDRVVARVQTGNGAVTTYQYLAPDVMIMTRPTLEKQVNWYRRYGDPNGSMLMTIQNDKIPNPGSAADQVLTQFTRDVTGKVLTITQGGVTRQYNYNANQMVSSVIEPETGTTTYTYYPGSTLLYSKQIGSTSPVTYYYDAQDRMSTTVFATAGLNINYSYDLDSRIASVSDSMVSRSYNYDSNGNKLMDKMTIDGYSFEADFAYNNLDQNYSVIYPDISGFVGGSSTRNVVSGAMDAFGNATAISDSYSSIVGNVSYNPNGMYAGMQYGNGAAMAMNLNPNQWPQNIRLYGVSNPVSLNYSYDFNGNVMGIQDTNNNAYDQSFAYDGLDRMVWASYPNGGSLVPSGGASNVGGGITYTDTGDITTYSEFAHSPTVYTYDSNTQHLTQTNADMTKNYSYDGYGQISSNSVYNFYYDNRMNMTSVTSASSGATVGTYVYDPSDLRVKKTAGGVTTYYFYSHGHIAFEATPNVSTKEYIYLGKDLIAIRTVAKGGSASYLYSHFNPILSTIAVSKGDGSSTPEHYNSYGSEMVKNTGFTSATDVRFSGHVSDDETGLVYVNARYYDPSIARFMSPDPEEFTEQNIHSFNKYCYGNNNPHKFVDADGHFGILAVAGLAFAAWGIYEAYQAYTKGDYVEAGIGLGLTVAGGPLAKGAYKLVKVGMAAKAAKAAAGAAKATEHLAEGSSAAAKLVDGAATGTAKNCINNCVSTAFKEAGASEHASWLADRANQLGGNKGLPVEDIHAALEAGGQKMGKIGEAVNGQFTSDTIKGMAKARQNGNGILMHIKDSVGKMHHMEGSKTGEFTTEQFQKLHEMGGSADMYEIMQYGTLGH